MPDLPADSATWSGPAAASRSPHTPVWFMRQAGRSLPEYRTLREGVAMLESCRRPDLVTEITLQPVRRYGVDAAIFFSDIVVPLEGGRRRPRHRARASGPVVAEPIRTRADLDRLPELDARPTCPTSPRPCGCSSAELGATPLIGFAGAPFTLASYLVEGGPSRNHARTKALMYGDPALWHDLLRAAGRRSPGRSCGCRSRPGRARCSCSTRGPARCPLADYREYVLPHSAACSTAVADLGVPRIHFGVGTGELLGAMGEAGADVVGVDFRVPLDEAARRVGAGQAVQGNLDPPSLFAPWDVVERGSAGSSPRRAEAAGPRLQPRPRRAARDRPRRADPRRRPGPRGLAAR